MIMMACISNSEIKAMKAPASPCSDPEDKRTSFLVEYAKLRPVDKRYRRRGRRQPRKRENRRRVRPGKSRGGYVTIGAPFNDNEFLLGQRNFEFDENTEYVLEGDCARYYSDPCDVRYSPLGEEKDGAIYYHACNSPTTISERCCEMPRSDCDIDTVASEGVVGETSDYGSLHSPPCAAHNNSIGFTSNSNDAEQRDLNLVTDITAGVAFNCDDVVFDEEFAMRNFEADYSAQQQDLREELTRLPRRQLEERCLMLMDQTKELEETRRRQELEQELESLMEENRQLRNENGNALCRNRSPSRRPSRSFSSSDD